MLLLLYLIIYFNNNNRVCIIAPMWGKHEAATAAHRPCKLDKWETKLSSSYVAHSTPASLNKISKKEKPSEVKKRN